MSDMFKFEFDPSLATSHTPTKLKKSSKKQCMCGKTLKIWNVAELISFYGDVSSVECSHCFTSFSKWRDADKLLYICDLQDGYHQYHKLGYGLCHNCIQSIDHNYEREQISNSSNDHTIIYLRLLNSFKLVASPPDFRDILAFISKQLKQITEYEEYLTETQIDELITILNDGLDAFLDQKLSNDFSVFDFIQWHYKNADRIKPHTTTESKESINSCKVGVNKIFVQHIMKYFQQNIISNIKQQIASESWQQSCDSVAAFGFCVYQLQKQRYKSLNDEQMATLLQKYQELKMIIVKHIDCSMLCVCNNLLLPITVQNWRTISSHTYSYNFCYLCYNKIDLYDKHDLQILCCEVDDSSQVHKNGFLVCNDCKSTMNNTQNTSVAERIQCILTISLNKLIKEIATDGDSKNMRAKFSDFRKNMSIFGNNINKNEYNILQTTMENAMSRYIPSCNCGEKLDFVTLHKERCRCKHCFEMCEVNETVYQCDAGKNCSLENLDIPYSPRKPFEFNIENDDTCGCGCVMRVNPKWYYVHIKCGAKLMQNGIEINEQKNDEKDDTVQNEKSKISQFDSVGDRIMYRLNCSLLLLKERYKHLSNRIEWFDFAISCDMFSYHLFLCQKATTPFSLAKSKRRKNRYRGRVGRLRIRTGSDSDSDSDDDKQNDDANENEVNKIKQIDLNKHKLHLMKEELNKMIQQIKSKIPKCECGEVYIAANVDMSYDVDYVVCLNCYSKLEKGDIGYVCKVDSCKYKDGRSRWDRGNSPKYLCRNCIDKNLIISGDRIKYQRLCFSLDLLKANVNNDAVNVKNWINAADNLRHFCDRFQKFDLTSKERSNLKEEIRKFKQFITPHVPLCVCGIRMIIKKYREFDDVFCKCCFLPIKYAALILCCLSFKDCKSKKVGYYFHEKCYKESLHCKFMNYNTSKQLKLEFDEAMENIENEYDDEKNNDDKKNNVIAMKCINMENYINETLQNLLTLNVKGIREKFYSLKSPPKTDEIDYEITQTIILKDLYTIIKNNSIVVSEYSLEYPQIIPESKLIKVNNDWIGGSFADKQLVEIISNKIENAKSVTFRVESKGFKLGYHLQIVSVNKQVKESMNCMKTFVPWSMEIYGVFNFKTEFYGFIECNHSFIIASNWMNKIEIFLPHNIVSVIALYFSKELPSEIEVKSWLEKVSDDSQTVTVNDIEFLLDVIEYKRDRRFVTL